MLDFGNLTLTGNEVVLRPLELDDANDLAKAASESRESYLYNSVPESESGAHNHINNALRQRRNGERFPFSVYWNKRIVGTTSYANYQPWTWPKGSELQRTTAPDALEIGYTWLAASAQRTRCNSEAKFLLLRHAFEVWSVHRVSLRTDERNAQCRRAIERLGAQFEGVRRGDKPGQDGRVRNSAFYSITIQEWPEIKPRFESLSFAQ